VVSVKGTLSYTALWEYRGKTAVYDMEEHLTPATVSTTFGRNFQAQRITRYLKGYLHQGATYYSGVWDNRMTDGKVRNDLREGGFRTVLREQRQGNHLLRSVSGYQLDGDVAYAGIWEH
jgi:hypothetical protein